MEVSEIVAAGQCIDGISPGCESAHVHTCIDEKLAHQPCCCHLRVDVCSFNLMSEFGIFERIVYGNRRDVIQAKRGSFQSGAVSIDISKASPERPVRFKCKISGAVVGGGWSLVRYEGIVVNTE